MSCITEAVCQLNLVSQECLDGWSAVLEAYAKQFNITKLKRIVTGGATGQESIYNGLKAIKEDNEETKDMR